jgi:hypothetical protein
VQRPRALLAAVTALLTLAQTLALLTAPAAQAVAPGNTFFEATWARTDRPVASLATSRTWMWGPEAFTPLLSETYAESPGGRRVVQYFDKSRMEITHPAGDQSSIWYVTNGLLVVELITGRMQTGDNRFDLRAPADVGVAGDPGDATGPTYATFRTLLDQPPLQDGALVTQRLARDGTILNDPMLAGYGVTAAHRVQVPGIDHQVASVFWEFMQSSGLVEEDGQFTQGSLFVNPFYATGFPLTEAYWATVTVGGQVMDVLVQCFERRCLTYTPSNPSGWQVEAGNVGRHYYRWRYPEAASITAFVAAADGGTFTLGDEVTVTIPPGALASDTTVTIARVPNPASLAQQGMVAVGHTYEISVDAVPLTAPVELAIAYDPQRLPDGSPEWQIQLAWGNVLGGGWSLAQSTPLLATKRVVTSTQHLSRWTPVVVPPVPCVDPTATATMTSQPGTVRVGQPFIYGITLTANACLEAPAVTTIQFEPPADVTLLQIVECASTLGTSQITCIYNRNVNVLLLTGTIAPHDTLSVRAEVRIPPTRPSMPETIHACALVVDGRVQGAVCVNTSVDLSVPPPAKTSNPDVVAPGETFEYVVSFTAHPEGDGSGSVVDQLLDGLEFISVYCFTYTGLSVGVCGYDAETRTVTANLTTLARWDLIRVVIRVRAPQEPITYQNCASIDDGFQHLQACAETVVRP